MHKKVFLLLLCIGLAGCGTPQKRAEKLAKNIDKKFLKESRLESAPSKPRDPGMDPAMYTFGRVVSTPVKLSAKGIRDGVRINLGWLEAPKALLIDFPCQVAGDVFKVFEAIGKTIVPPPKPKVAVPEE